MIHLHRMSEENERLFRCGVHTHEISEETFHNILVSDCVDRIEVSASFPCTDDTGTWHMHGLRVTDNEGFTACYIISVPGFWETTWDFTVVDPPPVPRLEWQRVGF